MIFKAVDVNEEGRLLCPVCGTDCLERHTDDTGRDDTAVYVHPDEEDHDCARGGYVEIAYQCAGGHEVELVIGNHQGNEEIAWVAPSV